MSGYNKLVPEIVQSSIWNEPSDIRIVWITMLAIKDSVGYVRGDANTIARIANVPKEQAVIALDKFQQPEPSSHTPDNDGRRIMAAPGGWIVLNHDAYRAVDHNEYMRNYMREHRKGVNNKLKQVNKTCVSVSGVVSVPDGESEGKRSKPKRETKPYGEFGSVLLTDAEHNRLVMENGESVLKAGIDVLDSYKTSKAKKYANDYAVLKKGSWVWTRVHESMPKVRQENFI
ncbi:MAG: hypothetical protein K9N51_02395 [Candidatus Pacebacteria bacterium]|nr:hypothetical protein [Candidatus Paceibacterota bacterium]